MLQKPSAACERCPLHITRAKPGEKALHECALLSAAHMAELQIMYKGVTEDAKRLALRPKYDCAPARKIQVF